MKIKRVLPKAPTLQARDVPQGAVYTWGTGAHMYLSTQSGAVCLTDGQHIPASAPANAGHFDQQVRVVECELHVQE
jgi:hypothetical protein